MAINITNIVSVVNAKLAALDSNSSPVDIKVLNTINDYIVNVGGVLTYQSQSDLPTAKAGDIAFVKNLIEDSVGLNGTNTGSYFFGVGPDSGWSRIFMSLDSADSASVPGAMEPIPLPYYQGTVAGFTSGGQSPAVSNVIDTFAFASDGNATSAGTLGTARTFQPGTNYSTTDGYVSGGNNPFQSVIQKFPFPSGGPTTNVGNLLVARMAIASNSSETYGYNSGGFNTPFTNVRDYFPFASSFTTATSLSNLLGATAWAVGVNSVDYGYVVGGNNPGGGLNTMVRFPYATGTVEAVSATMLFTTGTTGASSSATHGYTNGTNSAPTTPQHSTIQKFSFSAGTNATSVGTLIAAGYGADAGQGSTVNGYKSGGWSGSGNMNNIEKYSFAIDANATDVGDLTVARQYQVGQNH